MRNIHTLLGSFRTKVTIILILSMLCVSALGIGLVYRFTIDSQFKQLRKQLMVIAQTSALLVDADVLMRVPLSKEGASSKEYKIIADRLERVRAANPPVKFVYTMKKTEHSSIVQFIVDPDPLVQIGKMRGLTSYPGDRYDSTRAPELLRAFEGPSADEKLTRDQWGVFLSGYAPVRDKEGKVVAILGVDIQAEDVHRMQKAVHLRALFIMMVGVLVSVVMAFFISTRITRPVEKLADGTRYLAKGDLEHRVKVEGCNEIRELADSFNKMAENLLESRRRLHDYFYRVMQSLIKILEAKDVYTSGHSERVSEYSKKIALKMGFSPESAEMVHRVAQLHDIGKLVIHENILNKKGKLTEEERRVIQAHPIVGEDILKPMIFDKELLAIVRSHHERYDGVGYPDKHGGKDTDVYAQIITAADAFDAMVSARAYRSALGKEQAIEELKRNSGTQFNPEVISAFLKVLGEEGSSKNG